MKEVFLSVAKLPNCFSIKGMMNSVVSMIGWLKKTTTKCVYFKTANSKTPASDLNLEIRNIPIEVVPSVRVLGTIIHENLSWKEHMLALKSKLRATFGSVIRVKPYLSKHSLISIYDSLVISRIRYCIINWNHSNWTVLNQL